MDSKKTRPNRRIAIPRELYNNLQMIAYWQRPKLSTEDFIIKLLRVISDEYEEEMQRDAELAALKMKKLIKRTNLFNDPNNNNRFGDITF